MRYLKTISFKKISIIALSAIMVFANPAGGSAQDWPDPLVELVSINADTSSYFNDGKIKFNLSINRINGSAYSDITRVWICPKANWDGFLCNTGQFLVSTTPNSVDTNFVIESPLLTLSDGEYLITGVSFRNGAVISGFTLMYPRSGVVTIGGIATNIALANLAAADFILTTPVPEPEPTPERTPEPEPETTTEPESEPVTETQSDNQTETTTEAEAVDELGGTGEADTESETNTDAEPNTDPVVNNESEPNSAAVTEPSDQNSESSAQVGNESSNTENIVLPEPATQPVVAVVAEPEITVVVVVEPIAAQSGETNSPAVVTQSSIETTTDSPLTQPAVSSEEPNQLDISAAGLTTQLPITPLLLGKRIALKSAIGGEVLQLTGTGKVTKKISAGVSKLRLLRSQTSTVARFKLGSKVIAQLDLAGSGSKTITWQSSKPRKLIIKLMGEPNGELLIDALQIGNKLIQNPKFRSYS